MQEKLFKLSPKSDLCFPRISMELNILWSKRTWNISIYVHFWLCPYQNKRGLELVTSCYSGYKTSSEKFHYYLCIIWPSLMMYYKVVFWIILKITSANLCKPICDIIPPLFALLNLESVERKQKNYKNLNILRTKRAF